ncbi:MAG: hypothetical protein N4A33_09110 [Bacteriovoracaceae bacterium]|jgi:hypothetical protein|nr:hypothetical protein [Bacteriovoracaceae bacterium]
MKFFFLLLIPLLSYSNINPFSSDLCTGYKEGTKKEPMKWAHCCYKHDLRFWAGGTKTQRVESDLRLKSCVTKAGSTRHAKLIYAGVKLGSLSPYKLKQRRWGNAWGEKGYKKLTQEQIDKIVVYLHTTATDLNFGEIIDFIDLIKSK